MVVFCCFAHLPGETQLQPAQPKGILPRPDGNANAQKLQARSGQREGNIGAALIAPIFARDRIRAPLPLPHPYTAARSRRFSRRRRLGSSGFFNFSKLWPLFAKKKREPEFGNVEQSPPCSFFYAFTTGNPPFVTFLMVEMTYWTTSETKAIQLRQNMAAKPSASRIFGEHWPIMRFFEAKTRRQQHFNSNVAAAIPLALTLFLVLML